MPSENGQSIQSLVNQVANSPSPATYSALNQMLNGLGEGLPPGAPGSGTPGFLSAILGNVVSSQYSLVSSCANSPTFPLDNGSCQGASGDAIACCNNPTP